MKIPNLYGGNKIIMEHHPYITLNDGTEITYSDIKINKENELYVTIYFETPSEKYGFCDASIDYPGTGEFNVINHYTVDQLTNIIFHYNKIKDLVLDFAKEDTNFEKEENDICQII